MKQFLFVFFIISLGFSCNSNHTEPTKKTTTDSSLSKVIKTQELKAIVSFNSTDYYIDRGTPVGFQLDLLANYCQFMNLKLTPIVCETNKKEYIALAERQADLLVGDINPTSFRKWMFNFTIAHSKSPLSLVYRNEDKLFKPKKIGQKFNIYIPSHCSYYDYVRDWGAKHGYVLNIIFDHENSSENLIEKVALGEIDYTVSEEKVAINNKRLFNNLDFSTLISPALDQCWVLPKKSDSLRVSINHWLEKFIKTNQYKTIYSRYYNTTYDRQILENRHHYLKEKAICKWDNALKKVARKYNWDWKLIAALIYQESGFRPNIVGGGGCFGLFQLMPQTAAMYGISSSSSPEVQIVKGAKFLKYLERLYSKKVKNREQLSKFVLASFNAGPGHVIDAINLTVKYGKDPTLWDDNVAVFLRLKARPKYFTDPIVKSGYYRGAFTTKFVEDVWERYQHYKNFVK